MHSFCGFVCFCVWIYVDVEALASTSGVVPLSSRACASFASFSSRAFMARALKYNKPRNTIRDQVTSSQAAVSEHQAGGCSTHFRRSAIGSSFISYKTRIQLGKARRSMKRRLQRERTYRDDGQDCHRLVRAVLEVAAELHDVEAEVCHWTKDRSDDHQRQHTQTQEVNLSSQWQWERRARWTKTYAKTSGSSTTSANSSEVSPRVWSWFLLRNRR